MFFCLFEPHNNHTKPWTEWNLRQSTAKTKNGNTQTSQRDINKEQKSFHFSNFSKPNLEIFVTFHDLDFLSGKWAFSRLNENFAFSIWFEHHVFP